MGRFGDVLLVAGEPDLTLSAQAGEVVRFFGDNTANTRVFNVALPGARMKLVGGDSGRVEREQFVEEVVLAPSERVVVDVLFEQPGELAWSISTPDRVYPLAEITVTDDAAEPSLGDQFAQLRTNPELAAERERLAHLDAPSRTRRWRSSPRWTSTSPTARSSTPARCTPTSSGRAGTLPAVRHEAAGQGGRHDLRVPDAPRGGAERAGPLPAVRNEAARGARQLHDVRVPMHPDVVRNEPGRCPSAG